MAKNKFLNSTLIYRSDMIKDNDTRMQINMMQWKNPCAAFPGSTSPTGQNIPYSIFVLCVLCVCACLPKEVILI